MNVTASFQTQGDFHGWFFWNFRMEETVYREWDYLRGVKEGWIPKLERGVTVEQQTGTDCAQLCLLYTSPSPRDNRTSRMPSSA